MQNTDNDLNQTPCGPDGEPFPEVENDIGAVQVTTQVEGEQRKNRPQSISIQSIINIGVRVTLISLFLIGVWLVGSILLDVTGKTPPSAAAKVSVSTPNPDQVISVSLPPFTVPDLTSFTGGISRRVEMHTIFPTRPRYGIVTYTVKEGDTVFDIADKFGLNPKSIYWGNLNILQDNPHLLRPGMELNILPVDGVYHEWKEEEGLNGVANGYGVKPEDIINFPGNHLTQESVGDFSHPNIAPGTMLIIPNGQREFSSWASPRISRKNPASAKYLGAGYCPDAISGITGSGDFIFPSNVHILRGGFDYSPENGHYAVDFPGYTGDPIYASDTGVVVYSGWSNLGYGNIVVLDHGNGWQTFYAHLSTIYVSCGQGVFQGATIGAMGSTGNSTGPHLHFEMRSDTQGRANPWAYLH